MPASMAASARKLSPQTQFAVLFALLVLTAFTLGVSFLDIPARWHMAAGLSIAVLKASLVVLFFMHVIHSPAATRIVIVIAVFWLVAVLIALTMSDYATRGSIPFAPGH
jgi:cytochrome c oxidase subunit 4